jgi:hypothetical protein
MQFSRSVKNEAQTRRYSISATADGWEVRQERNGEVVERVRYSDWHRVEHARRAIGIELESLKSQGWSDEVSITNH